jgi:hypothetical protein
VHPLPSHLASKLIDERERELGRAADRAGLVPDGRSSRPKWRDRVLALMPGRQPRSKEPSNAQPEIYLRGPGRGLASQVSE